MKKFLIAILVIALLFTGTAALSSHFGWFEKDAETEDTGGAGDLTPIDPDDPTDTGTNTPSDSDTTDTEAPDTGDSSDTETPEDSQPTGVWLPIMTDVEYDPQVDSYGLDAFAYMRYGGKFKLVLNSSANAEVKWNITYPVYDDVTFSVVNLTPVSFTAETGVDGTYSYEFETDDTYKGCSIDNSPSGEIICDSYSLYMWVEDASSYETVRTWGNYDSETDGTYDLWEDVKSGGTYILLTRGSVSIAQGGCGIVLPTGEKVIDNFYVHVSSSVDGVSMTILEVDGDYSEGTYETSPTATFKVTTAVLYKLVK